MRGIIAIPKLFEQCLFHLTQLNIVGKQCQLVTVQLSDSIFTQIIILDRRVKVNIENRNWTSWLLFTLVTPLLSHKSESESEYRK